MGGRDRRRVGGRDGFSDGGVKVVDYERLKSTVGLGYMGGEGEEKKRRKEKLVFRFSVFIL